MKNFYYTRDYPAEENEAAATDGQDFLQRLVDSGILAAYGKFLKCLPKVIVPKDKESFERLVPKLDELAKNHHGKITAVVDYTKWQSIIDVYLPFFECGHAEEYALLRDIAESTHYFVVSAAKNGQTHIHIMINYFAEIDLYETINEDNIDAFVNTLYTVRRELEQEGRVKEIPGMEEADYKARLKEQIEYDQQHPEEVEDWESDLFDFLMGM